MPKDVVVLLVDLGNVLNSLSAPTSFIQQLQKVEDIEKAWKPFMKRNDWTVRSLSDDAKNGTGPGYETRYWAFISDEYPLVGFQDFAEFKIAKAAKKKMVDSSIWNMFKGWCEQHARFTSTQFSSGDVFFWLNEVYKFFSSQTPELIHFAPVIVR